MAAGLLQMDGLAGLQGWQWLFIAEGIPTIFLGACMPFLLPTGPGTARFLTTREAQVLDEEVTASRCNSSAEHNLLDLLKMALTNPFVYVMGMVKFGKDFTAHACMFWAPMLIRGLLHKHQLNGDSCTAWEGSKSDVSETGYKEVLLTAIPYSLAALANVLVAWSSQVCT
jgi:MFS transporter, ACS family, tartrate transporter